MENRNQGVYSVGSKEKFAEAISGKEGGYGITFIAFLAKGISASS